MQEIFVLYTQWKILKHDNLYFVDKLSSTSNSPINDKAKADLVVFDNIWDHPPTMSTKQKSWWYDKAQIATENVFFESPRCPENRLVKLR